MSRLAGWLYSLRSIVRRNGADRDMADEIAFHIDRQARKHETRGLSADDARAVALKEFGGTTRWREEARRARGSGILDLLEQDVRFALRGLRRDPAFAVMAVVTLALAIGANSAMFGIIDRLLLRGPEYVVAPEQLARVYVTSDTQGLGWRTLALQPYALYLQARDQTSAFTEIAAYTPTQLRVGVGIDSHLIPVTFATAGFFSLTGVRPVLGRFFTSDEDRPPYGRDVVVLGYQYWQREFAGDSSVLRKSIVSDGRTFRIVGVAPRGFTGVERGIVDAWIPMSARNPGAAADWMTSWNGSWARVVGRLAVSKESANAQLTSVVRRTFGARNYPLAKAEVTVRPIGHNADGVEPPELGVARLLGGVAVLMLIVAAANMTNLVLARAIRRRRELSVRLALGAGRWRAVRQMVVESVTISALGVAVGIVLGHWGGVLIRQTLLPDVGWTEMPLDVRVLGWTTVTGVVTGVVVGLIPAIQVSRGDVATALRAGRTGAGGESHAKTRASLQIAQLALSVVLLFTAGLFVRSLRNVRQLDLGFDRDRVLAVIASYPRADVKTPADQIANAERERARFSDLRERIARIPGVANTGISVGTPLFSLYKFGIRIPGIDSLPADVSGPFVSNVTPGYFETVGTRIVRGRGFVANEGVGTEPVVVINRTMAETLWPGVDPIGRCIVRLGIAGEPCARIVGIAANVHRMKLTEDVAMQYYVPYGQDPRVTDASVLLIRTNRDPSTVVPQITDVLRQAAPNARSGSVETLEQALDPQVRQWRVGVTLFTLFGLIVTAVAAIGLFGVVSYLVAQRTHELGVRIALGAQRSHVVVLVMGSGVRAALVGSVVGGVVSFAIAPLIQPLLFANQARDAIMLLVVAGCVLGVAGLATLWPSWQATRVDPLLALRAD